MYKKLFLAIGYRPLLNLPDHITLKRTAVRIPTKKTILVQNFGKVPTLFDIHFQEPFFTNPTTGFIDIDGSIEIDVVCKPVTPLTPLIGKIFFVYDNIKLAVTVECEVLEIDVGLETTSLVFDEIYIGLKANKTLRVYNR